MPTPKWQAQSLQVVRSRPATARELPRTRRHPPGFHNPWRHPGAALERRLDPPPLSRLPTFGEAGHVHVVETPKGSPNKYAFSDAFGAFVFDMVMPEGTNFPYDFGMIPSTKGADGNPLDTLL